MSDDYDDPDEPGGLWDPDAFSPPPAPERPALHIVTTQGTADWLDRPADATGDFEAAEEHALVRLEQFRPASDTTHWRPRRQTLSAVARRAAAAGILAMAVAATAIGYTVLSPAERPSQHAPTERLGEHLGIDSERAAATRKVASTSSAVHNERQPTSRAQRHAKSPRRPVTRSPKHSVTSVQPAPTTTASHAPPTSAATIVRPAAPTPRPQASAASASSEFGFEG
jgi:hypothetical protein